MLLPFGLKGTHGVVFELRNFIFERRDHLGLENIEGEEFPRKGSGEDTFTYFMGFFELAFGLLSKEGS